MAVQHHSKRYEIDMCSGRILPKLLQFTLPLMCSGILQLLFNAADIVVVGRWAGDNSLAAVGSNSALINLIVNLFIGLSVGANIVAAQCVGAGRKDALRKTVHTSMLLALLSGLFLTAVGVCCAMPLLRLMQVPQDVLTLSALYLRIYFLGMPGAMLYNFGAALLRAVGDTRRPLYYLLLSGGINVALNLLFVIVFSLDVAGVALATIISQYLSAILVVRCLMHEESDIRLELRKLAIDRERLKQILRLGIPSGLQGVAFSLSNVVIQSAVNSFGKIVIAGNAAGSNVESFVYTSVNAFSQANVAFTSQNYGAGRMERLRPILLWSLLCAVVVGQGGGLLVYFCGDTLLRLYTDSDAVVAAGMVRLTFLCIPYTLCALMDCIVGSIRGMGYAVMPTVVTLLGACAFRVVWIATVFQLPGLHMVETVFFSYPVSWGLTFIVHLVCYIIIMRRTRHRLILSNGDTYD